MIAVDAGKLARLGLGEGQSSKLTGIKKCTATSGSVSVEATSKKTIGVATCKTELQKLLVEKGVCAGRKKNEKVEYSFQFGKDDDKNKATGTANVLCKG